MKKIFLVGCVILSSALSAMEITIHTTCGTVVKKEISDNATLAQITQASIATNVSECGIRPQKVIVSIEP